MEIVHHCLHLIYYNLQICGVYIDCYTKMAWVITKSKYRISWMYIQLYMEYISLCASIIFNHINMGFLYLQIWMIRLYVSIRGLMPMQQMNIII